MAWRRLKSREMNFTFYHFSCRRVSHTKAWRVESTKESKWMPAPDEMKAIKKSEKLFLHLTPSPHQIAHCFLRSFLLYYSRCWSESKATRRWRQRTEHRRTVPRSSRRRILPSVSRWRLPWRRQVRQWKKANCEARSNSKERREEFEFLLSKMPLPGTR